MKDIITKPLYSIERGIKIEIYSINKPCTIIFIPYSPKDVFFIKKGL